MYFDKPISRFKIKLTFNYFYVNEIKRHVMDGIPPMLSGFNPATEVSQSVLIT